MQATILQILKVRFGKTMETERLFPLIAMTVATIALFTNAGGCNFVSWAAFMGASVLTGTGGSLLKKKYVDSPPCQPEINN